MTATGLRDGGRYLTLRSRIDELDRIEERERPLTLEERAEYGKLVREMDLLRKSVKKGRG